MDYNQFIDQLKRHEGVKKTIYLDTEGIPAGGCGHAFMVGSGLPDDVIDLLLKHDLENVERDFPALELPRDLNPVREYVFKNMLFNLGLTRLCKFKRMFAAIRRGDFESAASEMLDSKALVGGRISDYKLTLSRQLVN